MKLNDSVYNWLKWISLILLPAAAVLLSTVLPLYHVDAETIKAIVITINAVGAFIGALIGVSQISISKDQAEEEYLETDTEDDLAIEDGETDDEEV